MKKVACGVVVLSVAASLLLWTLWEEPVAFEDKMLRRAVTRSLGKPVLRVGVLYRMRSFLGLTFGTRLKLKEYYPKPSEMGKMSAVRSRGMKNIELLGGIEHAPNLTTLELCQQRISDISRLRVLGNLRQLELSHNRIEDISVLAELPRIVGLELSYNSISDISIVGRLGQLERLNLDFNSISDIEPVSKSAKLEVLRFYYNQVGDVSAVSGLKNLKTLEAGKNEISDVSALLGLTNLRVLALRDNQINDISALADLRGLEYLDLKGNPLNNEAYDVYLPRIIANNPDMRLIVDSHSGPGE